MAYTFASWFLLNSYTFASRRLATRFQPRSEVTENSRQKFIPNIGARPANVFISYWVDGRKMAFDISQACEMKVFARVFPLRAER